MVSIITIFLNAQQFIAESIESILSQTYGNWELLLVDDGSSDLSTQIARDYAERNPGRIRYLRHDGGINRGMSASRNLGAAHSRGDYMTFLDADDVWLPTMLERQVAIMDANPGIGMAQSFMMYWYSWSDLPDKGKDSIDLSGIDFSLDTVVDPPRMFPRYFRIDGPGTMTLFVRRRAFEQVGGFEEIFTGVHEDAAFVLKMYLSESVFVSSECLSLYRQHSNSFCSISARERNWPQDYLFFLAWLKQYLQTKGITDRVVWRAVERQEWPVLHPQIYRWRPGNVIAALKRRLAKL